MNDLRETALEGQGAEGEAARRTVYIVPVFALVVAWTLAAGVGTVGSCLSGCEPVGLVIGVLGLAVALPVLIGLLTAARVTGRAAQSSRTRKVAAAGLLTGAWLVAVGVPVILLGGLLYLEFGAAALTAYCLGVALLGWLVVRHVGTRRASVHPTQ